MHFLFSILATVSIISYNIRIGVCDDGGNSWDIRKPASAEMINTELPDIIGFQEAMQFQIRYLQEMCPEYAAIGIGQDDGWKKGEHMTFFYRKSRMECLEWGTFWLSATPDRPSMGWDGAYERTATWGLMKDLKTGRRFFYVNTHLDHVGQTARSEGLKLISDRIKDMNKEDLPVVLTGDFNCTVEDPALEVIEEVMVDTRPESRKTDSTGSFNNWGTESRNIDFIFEKGFRRCLRFKTLTDTYAGCPFISDHYPVRADLRF